MYQGLEIHNALVFTFHEAFPLSHIPALACE